MTKHGTPRVWDAAAYGATGSFVPASVGQATRDLEDAGFRVESMPIALRATLLADAMEEWFDTFPPAFSAGRR